MNKPLEVAPPMPAGSIDFALYEKACAKGDHAAAEKALLTDHLPKPEDKPDAQDPAPVADKPAA